jgi:uncharacterized protein YjbI with pentapeptide repeats
LLLAFWLSSVAAGDDLETLLATKMCPGCQLSGAELTGKDLNGANLAGANLSNAVLIGANLSGANLAGARLEKAKLIGVNLSSANCAGAVLKEASLIGAHAVKTNFAAADFSQANLSGARLTEASFVSATLSGVNLSGATLNKVDFTSADLKEAKTDGITFDSATKASLANANNIPEGLATRISGTDPKAKEKKTEVAAGAVTESEPDKTKSDSAATVGGLFTSPSNPSQYYHNARMHAQRGEIDLALATYEKLMTFKITFAEPAYDLPVLATRLYGKAGAKTYLEKKIQPIAPRHLYLLAQQVLSDAPLDEVGEGIIAEQIDYPPLLVDWAVKTQYLAFSRDWSADNRPSVLATLKIGHEFEKLHGSGEYLRYFLDPINIQSRTDRFRQVYQVQVNQITSQAQRCEDVQSGKRARWSPDWQEDCKRNDEDLVAIGVQVDQASASVLELEFWQSIKDSNNPDMYQAFLDKFPEGTFAALAKQKLVVIEQQKHSAELEKQRLEVERLAKEAAEKDSEFWRNVKNSENPEMYQAYLGEFPEGIYRGAARHRLLEIKQQRLKEMAQALDDFEADDGVSVQLQKGSTLYGRVQGSAILASTVVADDFSQTSVKGKEGGSAKDKAAEQRKKEDMDHTFVVLEGSPIKSFDDLNAKTLCEDTNDRLMHRYVGKYFEFHEMAVRVRDRLASQKHLAAKDMLEGDEWIARELLLGKCDFVAKRYPSAEYFLKKYPNKFRILPDLMDRGVITGARWGTLDLPRRKVEKIAKKAPEPERQTPSDAALINLVKLAKNKACVGCELRNISKNDTNSGKLDLSGVDLTDADLSGADLNGVKMTGAVFKNTKFINAIFPGNSATKANFSGADVSGATFTRVNFNDANLADVTATGAKFDPQTQMTLQYADNVSESIKLAIQGDLKSLSKEALADRMRKRLPCPGCDLREVDLSKLTKIEGELDGANFEGMDLSHIRTWQGSFKGAKFKNAKLTHSKGADLTRADVTGADFEGADLSKARLGVVENANLKAARLDGATLYAIKNSEVEGSTLNAVKRFWHGQGVGMSETKIIGVSLKGMDVSGINLRGVELTNVDLSGANLKGANLERAKLIDVELTGTNLSSADLTRAKLQKANLVQTNFSDAKLEDADLTGAIIDKTTKFEGATLTGINLSEAQLTGFDFSSASLERSRFNKAALQGVNFSNANLASASLINTKLKDVVFTEANLKGVDFSGAEMQSVDLSKLDLSGAKFTNANVAHSNLSGANLFEATIKDSNFSHTSLATADMGKVIIDGTNFDGANFDETNFFWYDKNSWERAYGQLLRKKLGSGMSEEKAKESITAKQVANVIKEKRAPVGYPQWQSVRLTNVDLSGRDLSNWKLLNSDFSGSNLANATFEQAILDGAVFNGADVSSSTFKEASIRGGSFLGATLNKKTRFPKTDLTDVSFLESKAKYVKFDKATLCRTILPDGKQDDWGCPENVGKIRRTGDPESNRKKLVQTSACPRCNLAGVDLSGVALECPDLTEADLTGANLSGVKFGRPQEQDPITKARYYTPGKCASFTRALLNESNFTEASLVLADFTSAEMKSVNFSKSMLWGAIFRENRLAGVNLSGADLTGAGFALSHLDGVDLRDVAWSGDFRIRDSLMSGVVFSGCSLAGAKFKHVDGIVIGGPTNLSGAVFEQGLPRINMVGKVMKLNLSRVDLSNTRFTASFHFGINYIDFSGSNLSGVDFRNVSSSGLARLNLTDANLVNAKPFGFYRKLLGDRFDDPERKESRTVICRTRFSWGEESINCKP